MFREGEKRQRFQLSSKQHQSSTGKILTTEKNWSAALGDFTFLVKTNDKMNLHEN